MKILCLFLFFVGQMFAAFNDRLYTGIHPEWEKNQTVEDRLSIIRLFLPENPTIFEVGAFDGTDSVKLAKAWPAGTIVSFEANHNQFVKYQEKASVYPNLQGYNLAVNTYNGVADFYVCWGSTGNDPVFEGASSLLPASEEMKANYKGPVIQVPCVIFDDWCEQNHLSAFDFMWLDLEGFELPFLKSSPRILQTVKVVYTETNLFNFRKGTTKFKNLKSFLEAKGFKMITHWYNEGLQGDAIFVRKEVLEKYFHERKSRGGK
jgi:FkbM family methyltransferase